ncbi:MAG TPA: formate dehydrogenase accessory protein FdhE [Steroidobacteraceae bacterium]
MQRILEPGQIESLAERSIPRIRLPDRAALFASRAARLRKLGEDGHAIGDYLRLMAALADAQQAALAGFASSPPGAGQLELARTHGMPVAPAAGGPRDSRWRDVLLRLCDAVSASPETPPGVRDLCARLRQAPAAELEAQADALLGARAEGIDAAAAPFLMAALQVCWVDLASRLAVEDVAELGTHGVCPVCGSLPVASIVHTDPRSQGYRYLHCALCATEWHMVRVTCSQCASTKGISYQAIEGGGDAVRAECCDGCRTYRKILYQEKDGGVEPVADDLASLALDLLLTEAGFHRGSGNPLLWQPRG